MLKYDHFYKVVYLDYTRKGELDDNTSPILVAKKFDEYHDAYYFFDQIELNRDLNTKAIYLIDSLLHSVFLIRQAIFSRRTYKVYYYDYHLNDFYRNQIVEELRNY